MNYLLVTVSILSTVVNNCIFNTIGKRTLRGHGDILKFNLIICLFCTAVFFVLGCTGGVSLFSIALGVLFGIMTAISNIYAMQAMSVGPMHITILIITSSMIIPALAGAWIGGESLSAFKLCAILGLIFFLYLAGSKHEGSARSPKWSIFCLIAFGSAGMVGVLQKIHQISPHKGELFAFLSAAFAFSSLYTLACLKKTPPTMRFTKGQIALALCSGALLSAINLLNLRLSGVIPSQIFFPLFNGGVIVLNLLSSILFFREAVSARQLIGLVGGALCLAVIALPVK